MSNKTVVLAVFNDEVSADAAAARLKDSGVAHGDAIGVLALNENGGTAETHPVSDEALGEAHAGATTGQA